MSAWPQPIPSREDGFTPIDDGPLAAHPAANRVRQAASPSSAPAILRQLARDPDVIVRAAVAINTACGPDVTALLANDDDERIRALLAARVARLLPNLDDKQKDRATEHVGSALATLARDRATRVRAAIAEEVKGMASAPRDLVLLLAQDSAMEVSDPIVRLSPVLTDADLLALLATPPSATAASAIASRPQLSAVVADAIACHADAPTVRALLSNQSACIQESTLDALVGRAPDYPEWHSPLVQRPCLSQKAIRAMSEFVAADLLRVLAARTDLDPTSLADVREHLVQESAADLDGRLVAESTKLKAANALTEAAVLDAAHAGDSRKMMALLAVAGGVSLQVLQRVIELRSAKAIVSFAWSCGFTMRTATAVQTVVAQLSPDAILRPSANGGFPLTDGEMEWQMELLTNSMQEQAPAGPTWSGRQMQQPA